MAAAHSIQPYALLRAIEQRSQQCALGLPQQLEIRHSWTGIGFRLGNNYLVSAMEEVHEILHYPVMTRVPSAQFWIKGIANVRGTLLPIMDLQGFIEGVDSRHDDTARVLVIRHGGLTTGLVVNEVLGMHHFFDEERCDQIPGISNQLLRYLRGAFLQADRYWGLFSMRRLAEKPELLEVAARG